jgi:hypothetical protein
MKHCWLEGLQELFAADRRWASLRGVNSIEYSSMREAWNAALSNEQEDSND